MMMSWSCSMPQIMQETAKRILPNWAIAGILGGFVIGTYVYSIKAVGDDSALVLSAKYTPDNSAHEAVMRNFSFKVIIADSCNIWLCRENHHQKFVRRKLYSVQDT